MYDSPLEYCPICKTYVALDQTQHDCAEREQCHRGADECPLNRFFAQPSVVTADPCNPDRSG